MAKQADGKWMAFRMEFLNAIDWAIWRQKNVVWDSISRWARENDKGRLDPNYWHPMKVGAAVPEFFAQSIFEYVSVTTKLLDGKRLSDIASYCESPEKPDYPRGEDPLHSTYTRIGGYLMNNLIKGFIPQAECFCKSDKDFEDAAHMIFLTYAAHHDKTLTEAEAIEFSTQKIRKNELEYAEMLRMFWETNENSVLFAMTPIGNELKRSAVTVILGVNDDFYGGFSNGEIDEMAINASDLLAKSSNAFVYAAAENQELPLNQARKAREWSLTRSTLFQLSSVLHFVQRPRHSPRLISFGGTPENEKRLATYGYRKLPNMTPVSAQSLMEFKRPKARERGIDYLSVLGEYSMLTSIVTVFQASVALHRRTLDL